MNSYGVVGNDAECEPRKASSFGSSRQARNAKMSKKNFSMLECGVPCTDRNLKKRAFQQAKEHANWTPT